MNIVTLDFNLIRKKGLLCFGALERCLRDMSLNNGKSHLSIQIYKYN